jgi:hypothetical protein
MICYILAELDFNYNPFVEAFNATTGNCKIYNG